MKWKAYQILVSEGDCECGPGDWAGWRGIGFRERLRVQPTRREFEPTHEIMALITPHKLNLQTCMRSHPMGLHVWFFVRSFVCFYTLCVWTVKALAGLCGCAGSPEPSLVAYVISTKSHELAHLRRLRAFSCMDRQNLIPWYSLHCRFSGFWPCKLKRCK